MKTWFVSYFQHPPVSSALACILLYESDVSDWFWSFRSQFFIIILMPLPDLGLTSRVPNSEINVSVMLFDFTALCVSRAFESLDGSIL